MAFLLAFGVIIGYFDRINLSVAHDALYHQFGLSFVAFGYLSSAFSWTYAAMQMPAGMLLDVFGIRRVGLAGSFVWSLASFLGALSPGLRFFFGSRFLLGIAEAPVFPGNAKAIGLWFPKHERSLAVSISDAAAKFSSAIGVPFLGVLLLHFGWRITFAATGALSLLYFFVFHRVYHNPEEDRGLTKEEFRYIAEGSMEERKTEDDRAFPSHFSKLAYLLRQPKVYGLALGWGAYNYSFFLFLTWLPTYLSTQHHMDLFHSAMYTSVPWVFATFTDIAVGGWMVDWLVQRGWDANRVRKSVMMIGISLGLTVFGAAYTETAAGALAWISLALGGLAAAAPVAWTVPSLIARPDCVGTLASIANFCGQLAAISAPIVTGYIVKGTNSFAAAFVTAAVILLAGIFGYGVLLGRIEPMN